MAERFVEPVAYSSGVPRVTPTRRWLGRLHGLISSSSSPAALPIVHTGADASRSALPKSNPDSSHKVPRDLWAERVAFIASLRAHAAAVSGSDGRSASNRSTPIRCRSVAWGHSRCIGKSTGSSGYASSSDGDPLSQRWSIQAQLPPAILAATQCRIPTDSAVIGCACASASSPTSTLSSL